MQNLYLVADGGCAVYVFACGCGLPRDKNNWTIIFGMYGIRRSVLKQFSNDET